VSTQPSGPVWPDTLESDVADGPTDRVEKRRRVRVPRDRAAVLGVGLAVLALVLLELGLSLDFSERSYWSAVPLWSAFATLCAVLGVLAFAASFPSGSPLRSSAMWRIAAGGLVGLAVFWLLVVLPVVASDRGFLLTAAVGALGGALWIGPGRKH
jgi:cobalamin synthase